LSLPPVLADAAAATVLAANPLPPVLAEAASAALLAHGAPLAVRTGHGCGNPDATRGRQKLANTTRVARDLQGVTGIPLGLIENNDLLLQRPFHAN